MNALIPCDICNRAITIVLNSYLNRHLPMQDLVYQPNHIDIKPFFTKIDTQFYSYTRGHKLIHYYKQIQKPAEKETNGEHKILYAELYWQAELRENPIFIFILPFTE